MTKEVGAAPLCLCEELDNGVFQFTFKDEGHAAVNEWTNHIERLQLDGKWYGRDKVYLMLDTRESGQLPLRYLFECLGDYNREYPRLVPPQVRLAYLYPASFTMLDVFKLFATLLPVPTVAEFFQEDAYQDAMNWLLADR
ncbi:hypothetical protein G4Y79_21405 [Phototrophicus methaneseepsis]|uniref:STAS/SEC14 domain-containing protein n=1 Tax=Phototrophicus methaneseepsis TaxID=2710758 RepID=A0A7S8ID56_9CHLR|nr:hypothetical protein [Phototrophicus methaneseepsis]QPC82215.1 hypothetical protein G4Y79_21405 [Phototrophicus methaneseepsis]